MKSYIKLLMLAGVMGSLTGCTDLDTPIDTRYPVMPDNPIAVDAVFNSSYRQLHNWFGRDFGEGVVNQGDEIMGCCYTIGNYYDDGRAINASIHSLTLNNWNTNIMSGCMEGITQTNKILLEYGGPEKNDPVVAPVRAARAFYHFWMMELFGDAPIIDHVVQESERIDRSPRADVAKFIESELIEILSQEDGLSKKNDPTTYGKPNYWMAASLLVKLYLNWGVYTHPITTVDNNTPNEKLADCVKWCDEIINSGIFEVGTGYRKKFFPDNGVHIKDFIYAFDVDPANKPEGTTTWHRWFGFKKEGLCVPAVYGWTHDKSLAGILVLTKECVARFNLPGDERNKMVLKGPQYQMDANYEFTNIPIMVYKDPSKPTTLIGQLNYRDDFEFDDGSIYSLGDESLPAINKTNIANGTALLNIQKGARLCKYPPREQDYTLYNRQQANDYPIFRYADILLTKAECIMRGAAPTMGHSVADLVNQVRDCAGAPKVTSFSMQDMLDERSREFILEPWRRNDLIRFGQFEAGWGEKNRYKVWEDEAHTKFHWQEREGATDPNRRLMPLHKDILQTNTNWSQNPGYLGI